MNTQKTTLPGKSLLYFILTPCMALGVVNVTQAAMDNTTQLSITPAAAGGLTQPVSGSYFSMLVGDIDFDGNPDTIYVPVSSAGLDGILLGSTQEATGSHTGVPDGSETPAIDNPWNFFNNTGMHETKVAVTVITSTGNTATLDFSGWTVDWNQVEINMGNNAWGTNANGVADVVCAVDCGGGDTYTIDYTATVPNDGSTSFGNVQYGLHLEGDVIDTNVAPVATGSSASLAANDFTTTDVTTLVSDAQGNGTIDFTTVEFQNNTCTSTSLSNSNGTVTITDTSGTNQSCAFEYRVADNEGLLSNWASISVTIAVGNVPPNAINDLATAQANTPVIIDVLSNDTDSDGTIDSTTVVASQGSNGATTVNGTTGAITYTPGTGYTGPDSFTYTVNDDSGDTSNTATVSLVVNAPPVAADDSASTGRNVAVNINVLANDSDLFGGLIDATTVSAGNGTNGTTSTNPTTGIVTYTPNTNFSGVDSFTYTVSDTLGGTSNAATATITVINNPPVANNDTATIDVSIVSDVTINVASNDTDVDGSLDLTSIVVTSGPSNGSVLVNTGSVTYTPNSGFTGTDSFTYTINDLDGDTSNAATASISVSNSSSAVLDPSAYMVLNSGTVGGLLTTRPGAGTGSWFTMELSPGEYTVTRITGLNHIHLSTAQPATTSGGVAEGNIDTPWQFFGNIGVHQTTSPVNILSDDGSGTVTLDFSGWDVSWNEIASIPMGAGQDNGIATLLCAVDCSDGDTYVLDYRAIVPPGDPSSFGGVNYTVHLEGTISLTPPILGGGNTLAPYDVTSVAGTDSLSNPVTIVPGSYANLAGNTTGLGLTGADINIADPLLNPSDGEQCIGGCFDISISGFSGDYVDFVVRLNTSIPSGAIFRKLIDRRWTNFDTSSGDLLGTATADVNGNCQGPDGVFNAGVRQGNQCIYIRIHDGGPNDADGQVNGTIIDPSGILLAGSPNVPASSTDGCSMSGNSIDILERADWLLVGAFLFWLTLVVYRNKHI